MGEAVTGCDVWKSHDGCNVATVAGLIALQLGAAWCKGSCWYMDHWSVHESANETLGDPVVATRSMGPPTRRSALALLNRPARTARPRRVMPFDGPEILLTSVSLPAPRGSSADSHRGWGIGLDDPPSRVRDHGSAVAVRRRDHDTDVSPTSRAGTPEPVLRPPI